ncbi:hypothetical protein [Solimonas terrae]|uniref:Uncharacterized protein n=1 Tax=Solimonas terrae TaxID=1396819 RepID=A0A6M2BN40_9GAMM|nr:hypothetical protein [Solimonas terrae]NGY03509.1 hypothetical protein [Solimonas terrae]
MKALNLFNAAMLALMASVALTLAVVCVLYAAHLDAAPRMRSEWYTVLKLTLVFAALTAIAGWAFWSHWRLRAGRWFAEVTLLAGLATGTGWIVRALG